MNNIEKRIEISVEIGMGFEYNLFIQSEANIAEAIREIFVGNPGQLEYD